MVSTKTSLRPASPRAFDEKAHDSLPDPEVLVVVVHGETGDLGLPLVVDVQRAAAVHHPVGLEDHVVVDRLVQINLRSRTSSPRRTSGCISR